ncbi:S-layer homology domain-containing protein [Cohnella caldifontis]|uniref:S-layer homology domain-containing protein n=1 Tax=Cohnella caldifontis TaxID=3027471 RepID=UPI0023EDB4BF|nr:S-layer homology domain-containing protein [Cohnella sp. YIM B05605]
MPRIKGRKLVYLVWSFALFLGVATVPCGVRSAHAADIRIGSQVKLVSAGANHWLARKDDGSVFAWGLNILGQTSVPAEAQSGVVSVAAGSVQSLALKDDGSIVTWGVGIDKPGSNYIAIAAGNFHSLALQSDGTVVVWDEAMEENLTVPSGLSGVVAIAAAMGKSLALKDDGSVVAWNYDYKNDLVPMVVPVEAQNGVVKISAGYNHSLAIKEDGSVISWSDNGSLKNDVPDDLSGVVAIAAGWDYSLALTNNGTVVAWGTQSFGVPPEAQSGVVAIAAGPDFALALKDDGSVVAWGDNSYEKTNLPGDNTLQALSVDEGTFAEPFSSSTTAYTAHVGPSVSSVHVSATVTDATYTDLYINNQLQTSGSTVTVGLSGPSTVISVQVEPLLKAVKTYTITIVKDSEPPSPVAVVTGISANTARLPSSGGGVSLSITGDHLTGQTLEVYVNGAKAVNAGIKSDTEAEAIVTLPGNDSTSSKAYLLTVYLNGEEAAGQSATVTVQGAYYNGGESQYSSILAKPAIDLNGTPFDPSAIDFTKSVFTMEATPTDGTAYVSLPAAVLNDLASHGVGFTLEFRTPIGSYLVPSNLPSLIPGLNDLLGNRVDAEDTSFKITLTDKSADKVIQADFSKSLPNGVIQGATVDFHIDVLNNKTNQTIGTASQFSQALTRMIPMPQDMKSEPGNWGAYRYNEPAGKFEFVPAEMVRIDGKLYSMIKSYSNSVYVTAQNAVSFADIQKHWGKAYVELAAAKTLVNGVGGGKYDPDKTVSRAEFASMLVNALGRGEPAAENAAPYADVQPGAWYFGAVVQAKKFGLLDFAKGSRFLPNEPLTREEMATMLAAFVRLENSPKTSESVSLNGYKDIGQADAAYLENIRQMIQLNIMKGTGTDTFDPKGATTRAQAAVVLIRTLQAIGWIDGAEPNGR